jgi:LemA protein
MATWLPIGIIAFIVLWVIFTFNRLVAFKNQMKNAWSQIDVQLKRRHDLIPNLVNTVKGYAKHERETLENVTKARQQAVDASGVADQAQAENFLTQTLRSLFAVVENYPDLKANRNFLELQEELTSTENRISFARQFYNDTTLKLNNKIEQAPSNIIAKFFNFKQGVFFEIEDVGQREAPAIQF